MGYVWLARLGVLGSVATTAPPSLDLSVAPSGSLKVTDFAVVAIVISTLRQLGGYRPHLIERCAGCLVTEILRMRNIWGGVGLVKFAGSSSACSGPKSG